MVLGIVTMNWQELSHREFEEVKKKQIIKVE